MLSLPSVFWIMSSNQFIIRLNGLTVGSHLFEMDVNDTFFEGRDYSDLHGVQIKASVELVKHNSLISLNFDLSGTIGVMCDRCTKPYPVPVDVTETMHVRFGNPDEEHPENVLVLPFNESDLDISQPLYEFITLALPQRLVPCEEDPGFKCDKETLKKLNNISVDEPEQQPGDSIWDKLKDVNFNNN